MEEKLLGRWVNGTLRKEALWTSGYVLFAAMFMILKQGILTTAYRQAHTSRISLTAGPVLYAELIKKCLKKKDKIKTGEHDPLSGRSLPILGIFLLQLPSNLNTSSQKNLDFGAC